MKTALFAMLVLFSCHFMIAQQLSGKALLEKSIQYHDSNNQWDSFRGNLKIIMEMPEQSRRVSQITINLPKEYFKLTATRDSLVSTYEIDKGTCTTALNGKTDLSEAERSENNMSCERANLYKNYYTYLYGLPMKLKDEGTHISEVVEEKHFKGKDYLVLKVTYDKTVGNDIWFFYFNPETYAMEIYQFFKTNPDGTMDSKSGEYIMLYDTEIINGIKMPKIRRWYYNKDESYLATDTLYTN